jgi:hypothetical protein
MSASPLFVCSSCGQPVPPASRPRVLDCPLCGQAHWRAPSQGAIFPFRARGISGGMGKEVQWPLKILSHHRYTSTNWFYIVGEVYNPYELPMQSVDVVATLYDKTRSVIGVTSSLTSLPVIPPQGRSPFKIGTDNWAEVYAYDLQAEGRPGGMPRQDLVITNQAVHVEGSWLQVFGEVRNIGRLPATNVRAVVTLYNAQGEVSGTGYAIVQTRVLAPGDAAPFRCGINHFPNFEHYLIQAQGE